MTIKLILKNAGRYEMALSEYERLRAVCTAEAAPGRGHDAQAPPGKQVRAVGLR